MTFDRGMETTQHGFHLFEGRQPVDIQECDFHLFTRREDLYAQLSAQAFNSL